VDGLPSVLEAALFRIIQEATPTPANMLTRAGVQIKLLADAEQIGVIIRDWGKGFDLAEVSSTPEQGLHMGWLAFGSALACGRASASSRLTPARGQHRRTYPTGPHQGPRRGCQVITVLLVDDQAIVREGLRSMLGWSRISPSSARPPMVNRRSDWPKISRRRDSPGCAHARDGWPGCSGADQGGGAAQQRHHGHTL